MFVFKKNKKPEPKDYSRQRKGSRPGCVPGLCCLLSLALCSPPQWPPPLRL